MLSHFRRTRDILRCLALDLEGKIASLQLKVRAPALALGMRALPVELLSHVFDLTARHTDGKTYRDSSTGHFEISEPFALSYVCRHFRQASLSLPHLWSRLGTPEGNRSLYHFLMRGAKPATPDARMHCHKIS